MPKTDTREYRYTSPFVCKREGEGETEQYIVEGYATTFEQPYMLYEDWEGNPVYEVIDRNAFEGCDMSDCIMQYNHEGHVYARQKNGTLSLLIDEHGLFIRANLGGTEIGRSLYNEIKGGYTDQMSFAFTIAEEEFDKKSRTYRIKRLKRLYDVSAVATPANPYTDISASRKRSLEGVIKEEQQELLKKREAEKRQMILRLRLGGK